MKRMRLTHILFSVFFQSLIKKSLRTDILNSFGYTTTTTTTTTTTIDDDDDNNNNSINNNNDDDDNNKYKHNHNVKLRDNKLNCTGTHFDKKY